MLGDLTEDEMKSIGLGRSRLSKTRVRLVLLGAISLFMAGLIIANRPHMPEAVVVPFILAGIAVIYVWYVRPMNKMARHFVDDHKPAEDSDEG
jgi:hypothetical protein